MKSIQIGAIVAKNRRAKGITQEELAEYLGVSKPAVSKWESGQSYPDITLVPLLAAYFNLSADELLGYTPQLTREQVQSHYVRLSKAFSMQPFEAVLEECTDLTRKYYSCWRFLFAMGSLLINHAPLAPSPERARETYEKTLSLFERVEKESGDAILSRQSLQMQALCHIVMGNPALAIDLLGDIVEPPMSTETLLAKAYYLKGDFKKAISLLQSYLYTNILGIFGTVPDLLALYVQDSIKLDQCLHFMQEIREAVDIDTLHPAAYLPILVTAAHLYATIGKSDQALAYLEDYVALSTKPDLFPLKLHGSSFFDSLDPLFSSLEIGVNAPRDDALIKLDLKKAVLQNPAFSALASDDKYIRLAAALESI